MSAVLEQCENPKSRMKVLDELLDKFTNDEIRRFQAKLNAVDFRCDPVGKLPSELWYQILQYLDIYQLFQAQRVSRTWYLLLTSNIVETLTLRSWSGSSDKSPSASRGISWGALPERNSLSPISKASFQARHKDSFQNGTAFSKTIGSWSTQPDTYCHCSRIAFAGSTLAWTDQQAGFIQLRCLASGQDVSLSTPMREEIREILMSDETIVAMTHSGRCFAWDLSPGIQNLEGQSSGCIEVKNGGVGDGHYLHISGHTFASVYYPDVNDDANPLDVTTWDIKGRQSHQFRINPWRGTDSVDWNHHIIDNSGERSLIFFEYEVDDPERHIYFVRTNLKGQSQSRGSIELPDDVAFSLASSAPGPIYTANRVTLFTFRGDRGTPYKEQTEDNIWDIMRVIYDTKADRLELQIHTVKQSIQTKLCARDFIWWNDVAYLWNGANELVELELLDLGASVCKKAEMSSSTVVPKIEESDIHGHHADVGSFLLGNESFLIIVQHGQYTAWCFEDVRLADEDQDYRAMMTRKKKERLDEKKRRLEEREKREVEARKLLGLI